MKNTLRSSDIVNEVVARDFFEGAFLGNGDMGAVIWGAGSPLIFSLDKINFWELRRPDLLKNPEYNFKNLKKWMDSEPPCHQDLARVFQSKRDLNARIPFATKLPVGQAKLYFGKAPLSCRSRLSIDDGLYSQKIGFGGSSKGELSAFIHEKRNLLCLRVKCHGRVRLRDFYSMSSFSAAESDKACIENEPDINQSFSKLISEWGYPKTRYGQKGLDRFWLQPTPAGSSLVAMWRMIQKGACLAEIYLALEYLSEEEALKVCGENLDYAQKAGYNTLLKENRPYWDRFWAASDIQIPDEKLQQLFNIEKYKFASTVHPRKYQLMLMGVWTPSSGLPCYGGDFHLNLLQMCYDHIYTGNHLEFAHPFYDWFTSNVPKYENFCKRFFGIDGVFAYNSNAFDGGNLADWWLLQFWHGGGAWVAFYFWRHYLYSGDENFLRNRVYPIVKKIGKMYQGLLERGEDGKLHLRRSSSPEYHGGSHGEKTWSVDSSIDLALAKLTFQTIVRCIQILKLDAEDLALHKKNLADLADYPTRTFPLHFRWLKEEKKHLMIWREQPLLESHRHHSHLAAIYPLGLLSVFNKEDRELVETSIEDLIWRGTGEWAGWSFPWASSLYSRSLMPNAALNMLKLFPEHFISRNTFHRNISVTKSGVTTHELAFQALHVFSLEGSFMFLAAIYELLFQSYEGKIIIFPSIPDEWKNKTMQFAQLRAEGGFLITAQRKFGRFCFAKIKSTLNRHCRVRNNFELKWRLVNHAGARVSIAQRDGWISWDARKDETYYILSPGIGVSDVEKELSGRQAQMVKRKNIFGVKEALD